ncbi:hypothetical protein [Borrelia turcica]|nr:hypothetical protein [Borrelia turcica]
MQKVKSSINVAEKRYYDDISEAREEMKSTENMIKKAIENQKDKTLLPY